MINYLLIALLFVISFILSQNFLINLKAEKYKKKNIRQKRTNENFFKHFFSKFNFIKTKENFLSKQGYPLKLNTSSYFFTKIVLCLLFASAGIVNYRSYLIALIFGITGFFIIDLYIFIRKKSRDEEICTDLMNITNSMCMQLSAEVSLKDSIKKQYENCKNDDFKKAMLEFATTYELSELNIVNATQKLSNKFDILEIDMFCKALQTYNETTQISNILENLAQLLKKKSMDKTRRNTITKVLYITIGVVIALGNIVLITFYPLFISIGKGFNNIFK